MAKQPYQSKNSKKKHKFGRGNGGYMSVKPTKIVYTKEELQIPVNTRYQAAEDGQVVNDAAPIFGYAENLDSVPAANIQDTFYADAQSYDDVQNSPSADYADDYSGQYEADDSAENGEEDFAENGVEDSADYAADASAESGVEDSADYAADDSADYADDYSGQYEADDSAENEVEDSADYAADDSADYGAEESEQYAQGYLADFEANNGEAAYEQADSIDDAAEEYSEEESLEEEPVEQQLSEEDFSEEEIEEDEPALEESAEEQLTNEAFVEEGSLEEEPAEEQLSEADYADEGESLDEQSLDIGESFDGGYNLEESQSEQSAPYDDYDYTATVYLDEEGETNLPDFSEQSAQVETVAEPEAESQAAEVEEVETEEAEDSYQLDEPETESQTAEVEEDSYQLDEPETESQTAEVEEDSYQLDEPEAESQEAEVEEDSYQLAESEEEAEEQIEAIAEAEATESSQATATEEQTITPTLSQEELIRLAVQQALKQRDEEELQRRTALLEEAEKARQEAVQQALRQREEEEQKRSLAAANEREQSLQREALLKQQLDEAVRTHEEQIKEQQQALSDREKQLNERLEFLEQQRLLAQQEEQKRREEFEELRRRAISLEEERRREIENLRQQAELEAQRQAELEAQRQAELEAQRQAELEAQRQAELEAQRQAELEAQRQAELEAQRQAELEAQRQAELEAQRQAELEAQRQAELEAQRQAELEAQRQAELEAQRQAELEAQRQAEFEAQRQAELEAQRQAELEAQRQAELEAQRQAEFEAQRQAELEAAHYTTYDNYEEVAEYSDEYMTQANIAKIKVIGVGGAGSNAVNRMIELGVDTAEFFAVNTDKQALMLSLCDERNKIQIGAGVTKGLGAGADPTIGEQSAEESKKAIEEMVKGVDLLFIAAGMGGGTGTGAAPIVAKTAKDAGCVTVAVVTKPFHFEGRNREVNAKKGIENLSKYVDTIIIIPNDRLLEALPADTPFVDALKYADDTLRQGICGIADLIATPSLINLDFADVRTILKNQGLAHMGVGKAKGENRVIEAVRQAVASPLLETTIEGARSIILNVTGGKDLSMAQVKEAADRVKEVIDPAANIIFGMNVNPELQEEIIITIIATGFDKKVGEDQSKSARPEMPFKSFEQKRPAEEYMTIDKSRIENPAREPQYRQQPRGYEPTFPNRHVEEPSSEAEPVAVPEDTNVRHEKKELPSFVRRLFGNKK